MDKKKLEELQSKVAVEMDDRTCEGVEDLYFYAIAALTGREFEDLWRRFNVLYDTGTSAETDTVSQVGRELGFPPMWELVGAVLSHLDGNRQEAPCKQQHQAACAS